MLLYLTKEGLMFKKYIPLALAFLLLLPGCKKQEEIIEQDTSNGPVVSEDTRTDEEKILEMIQSCINDYNEGKIPDIEESLKSEISPLPLDVESLPQINSLEDLVKVEVETQSSNIVFLGYYEIQDKYKVTFKVYHPGGYFWLNGDVVFDVDLEKIQQNNPEFAEYKQILDPLLQNATQILDYLHGLNVNLAEEELDQYYEVLDIDGRAITSIQQLKDLAESVYTVDFLQNNFYKNAFEGDMPIYKEMDGKLYCLGTDVTPTQPNIYDTSYILAVKQDDNFTKINLLTKVMDQTQNSVKEITITQTEQGYRLPEGV